MTESKVDEPSVLENVEQVFGRKSKTYAAVAELIKAAKGFDDLPLTGNFELDAHEYGPRSVRKAMRLRAALAACTPAKPEGR